MQNVASNIENIESAIGKRGLQPRPCGPGLEFDLKLSVIFVMVVVGLETKFLRRGDVCLQIINVKRLRGVEVQILDGDLKNFIPGFTALGGVGINAASEGTEDVKLRQQVVFVQAAGIGKQLHRYPTYEGGETAFHRLVLGENLTPDGFEIGCCTLELQGRNGLADKCLVVHVPIFKRQLDMVQAGRKSLSRKGGSLGDTTGGDAEVEKSQHIANIGKEDGGGHTGLWRS